MSSPSRRTVKIGRTLFLATALMLCGAVGCWEQWSDTWFPQMKRQKAVQAFETLGHEGRIEALTPPDGTVPVFGAPPPALDPNDEASQDLLVNPVPMSLESLENGRMLYARYCVVCHGESGAGDGPVSMTGELAGPLGGVLPLVVTAARSDGHIYSTIRYGRRRMPEYKRIPDEGRWDLVHYIRYLTGQAQLGQNRGGGQ